MAACYFLLSGHVGIGRSIRFPAFHQQPPGFASQSIVGDVPISEDPFYQDGGPAPLFLSFPFLGRAGIFNTGADVTNFLVMLVLAFLIYKTVGPQSLRRLPHENMGITYSWCHHVCCFIIFLSWAYPPLPFTYLHDIRVAHCLWS